jgi:uncharacterized protein (TIGR02757 family)
MQSAQALKALLDNKAEFYNNAAFIPKDPVCIPHRFSVLQDIEIAGFFAATLAWGNRTTIINNCTQLMKLMDDTPHQFIVHHAETDLKRFLRFVHRTFNATDLLYFIYFLHHHYNHSHTLEDAFVPGEHRHDLGDALRHFHNYFFSLEHPTRTHKHVATPQRQSACKRLNMYLRWMVRKDDKGVDFGLWTRLKPSQLVCPLDVHVARVAWRLGLLPTHQANWQNALYLTQQLKQMNPDDPVVYDFALFGLGAEERF